jgi:hypothetical protein
MKSALALSGLVAGALVLVLASGCSTDPASSAGNSARVDPPIGSHIVRRPPAPTSNEQEREKTGERPAGQAIGVPPLNRP